MIKNDTILLLVRHTVQLAVEHLSLSEKVRENRVGGVKIALNPVPEAQIARRETKLVGVNVNGVEHLDTLIKVRCSERKLAHHHVGNTHLAVGKGQPKVGLAGDGIVLADGEALDVMLETGLFVVGLVAQRSHAEVHVTDERLRGDAGTSRQG